MSLMYSQEDLQPLKELIFGLQKQANVQNDAVVGIIAQELVEKAGVKSFASSNLKEDIFGYLYGCGHHSIQPNEAALRLIIGEESYNAYKSADECEPHGDYPNPESPKYVFRLLPVSDADRENRERIANLPMFKADREQREKQQKLDKLQAVINSNPELHAIMVDGSNKYGTSKSERIKYIIEHYPHLIKDTGSDAGLKYVQAKHPERADDPIPKAGEESLYDRACKIRDDILKTAPASVKKAIPNDDWAVAVYCAPYYYGVK